MSMSVSGLSSDPHRMYKNSFHWRNNSGELDVFEAARYFSSANDHNPGYINGANFSQKFVRGDRQHVQRSAARMSLDMPMRNPIPPEFHHVMDQKQMMKKENKKYKQPSSPGGRLASFLNSLFSQTSLKKKKSKSGKDFEEESPGGRRKRRSSISHFRITTTVPADNHSKSGFRTPPPYAANTPTKPYKEFRNLSEFQQTEKTGNNFKRNEGIYVEKKNTDYAWMEEKSRPGNGAPEKILTSNLNSGIPNRNSTTNWSDLYQSEERKFRKFSNVDDGADSDSSSDLFDLPNHELDFYSSSLPVYETTHMDKIKISAPISRTTTV